jgi:hypothetical protein
VAVVEFKKEFELFLLNVRHFHEAHQQQTHRGFTS